MKIALVILHADPSRGGAERYTIDLASALARAGHDVSLLASSFSDPCLAAELARRVVINAHGLTRIGRYKRFLDSLDAHLDQTKYDIVHAMLPVRRCDIYHPHAGLAVASFHGAKKKLAAVFNPRRIAFACVERKLIQSKPIVIALSEYVKRSIREHYDLDDAHLPTLFNAVDLGRFQPEPHAPRNKVTALFVGQDFNRKGLYETLETMSSLDDPNLRLTVVGGKVDDIHVMQLALKSGATAAMAERVTWQGSVADARPFYRDADFFVLPTKHDPCSLVVLEALAMGLPVITTKYNGAAEIMTDGVHGYVLDDPRDVKALAARMRDLMDDDRRKTMSEACLALRPALSYDSHLSQLDAIYARIQKRSGT